MPECNPTIQRENMDTCAAEIEALAAAYWAETRGAMENPTLAVNIAVYQTYEAQGNLVCMTVRLDASLVGFMIYMILPRHPHHETRCGVADAWYIAPRARSGLVGLRLLRHMEQALLAEGCTHAYAGVSCQKDVSVLLRRRHFVPVEVMYCKQLEGG